jgi:hypothetical protein
LRWTAVDTFVFQRLNGITAPLPLPEPQGPDDTPEKLEAERQAAQNFIDNGMLLKLSIVSHQ